MQMDFLNPDLHRDGARVQQRGHDAIGHVKKLWLPYVLGYHLQRECPQGENPSLQGPQAATTQEWLHRMQMALLDPNAHGAGFRVQQQSRDVFGQVKSSL